MGQDCKRICGLIPRKHPEFVARHLALRERGRYLTGGYSKLPLDLSHRITREDILAGKGNPAMRDMVALNLGCALHLLEDGLTLKQGVDKARDAIASGIAAKFFKDVLHA